MTIIHYEPHKLGPSPHREAVWEMLCTYAGEFVPPLNQRASTTQQSLHGGDAAESLPVEYFDTLQEQDFLLAMEGEEVLGFLSFREDYAPEALRDCPPCAYVSTILIREEYRKKGITRWFYQELLSGKHHNCRFVCTRTWSGNEGHLKILEKLGFDLVRDIPNDRGAGIDTLYYRRAVDRGEDAGEARLSLWQKFLAYKLDTSVYALIFLMVSSVVFVWIYLAPPTASTAFVPELALAIATSLLASIFCMLSDTYINYRSRQNDKLLEDLHTFGIRKLHFNKQALVRELLQDCGNYLWISGCRLILTRNIAPAIARQLRSRPDLYVRCLVCPPWTQSYHLIYGEDDNVMDNYFAVFRTIQRAREGEPVPCRVHVLDKPLFNDTYKFDKITVTGPFLHARDDSGGRITANDFFTYDVIRRSRLQALMEGEYATLWDEAPEELDWDRFQSACERYRPDMTEEEKAALLRECCVPIREEGRELLLPRVKAEYADI